VLHFPTCWLLPPLVSPLPPFPHPPLQLSRSLYPTFPFVCNRLVCFSKLFLHPLLILHNLYDSPFSSPIPAHLVTPFSSYARMSHFFPDIRPLDCLRGLFTFHNDIIDLPFFPCQFTFLVSPISFFPMVFVLND